MADFPGDIQVAIVAHDNLGSLPATLQSLAAAGCPLDRVTVVDVASADGTGRIWDVATGSLIAPLIGHTHFVVDIAFSKDDKYVVTSSRDRTARVWSRTGVFQAR